MTVQETSLAIYSEFSCLRSISSIASLTSCSFKEPSGSSKSSLEKDKSLYRSSLYSSIYLFTQNLMKYFGLSKARSFCSINSSTLSCHSFSNACLRYSGIKLSQLKNTSHSLKLSFPTNPSLTIFIKIVK